MKINFLEPSKRIKGKENKSKLLLPDSDLYKFISQYRQNIINTGSNISENRMDLHIEILKRSDAKNEVMFLKNVLQLENNDIDVENNENFGFLGKAFVLFTNEINNYGKTHITIVYFTNDTMNLSDVLNLKP